MTHRKVLSWTVAVLVGLGVSIATLGMSQPAHAGGVHLSIGIGIPAPVYVAPAPVVVQPAPAIVYPGVVYPPPGAFTVPCDIYGRPLPPGLAKRHHGYHHPAYGYNFYNHGRRGW
jgi:hypothetical protein